VDSDDLVIGSGLAALGAVLGLLAEPGRRVTVLCGPQDGRFLHYDERALAPCAYLGPGGLGSHWHGVIPTGLRVRPGQISDADFCAVFRRFYPHAGIDARVGKPALFVPWRPIRPWAELRRLAATHGAASLNLVREPALHLRRDGNGVDVETAAGTLRTRRCWVAAGALRTPALLAASFGKPLARGYASDHVLCYLGQVRNQSRPDVRYTRHGFFFPVIADPADRALYTLRPARFDFRRLDAGFERRQIFGLPTGTLLAKLMGRVSPGLLAEVFYNRLGLFGGARWHSVYAQIAVRDAYAVQDGQAPLRAQPEQIRAASDAVRAAQPYSELRASRRPDLYLPGIHLHHTLDTAALAAEGLGEAASPVQVIDASALADLGAEHHSFKMLVHAHARVQRGAASATRP
jgi:hypothetical protein